jgi:5S rRNA maturation endonuclease (ribonuclease M5)
MQRDEYIARLTHLTEIACDNIEDILKALHIRYKRSEKRFYGRCPVHHGNNNSAWNLYPEGHTSRGVWYCYTKLCHKQYGHYLADLVRAVLTKENDTVTEAEAVQWLCDQLGYENIDEVPLPDHFEIARKKDMMIQHHLTRGDKKKVKQTKINREQAKAHIDIPAQYYLDRGYSEDVLVKFDVGTFESRVVVPIFDEEYEYVIGRVARSIHEQCQKCKLYHNPEDKCPQKKEAKNYAKWTTTPGLTTTDLLYNYWNAKPEITKTKTAILVEGAGDVWRLDEAGFTNAVALLTSGISYGQSTQLLHAGAMNVVVLTDADEAGRRAATEIYNYLNREFYVYAPLLSKKDVGEMSVDEVKVEVGAIFEKLRSYD